MFLRFIPILRNTQKSIRLRLPHSVRAESGTYPFVHSGCIDRNDIESTGRPGPPTSTPRGVAILALQPVLRGANQTPLLESIDTGRCAAEAGTASQPDFDEDNAVAIARDDVDLSLAKALIARHDATALRHEVLARRLLGLLAGALSGRARAAGPRRGG
jgi:hypothetical protein